MTVEPCTCGPNAGIDPRTGADGGDCPRRDECFERWLREEHANAVWAHCGFNRRAVIERLSRGPRRPIRLRIPIDLPPETEDDGLRADILRACREPIDP